MNTLAQLSDPPAWIIQLRIQEAQPRVFTLKSTEKRSPALLVTAVTLLSWRPFDYPSMNGLKSAKKRSLVLWDAPCSEAPRGGRHYVSITHRNGAPALLFHLSLLLASTVDDTCELKCIVEGIFILIW